MPDPPTPTETNRPIAVTGATGFVGRHVIRSLIKRGRRVRALIRDARTAHRTLPETGVDLILGDVLAPDALGALVEGSAALVHLVGIRREQPGGVTFEKLHVAATRHAVTAARRAGVTRYVQMSALGARPDAVTEYHRTKWRAELIVRDSGLAWTILRPSLILGADGEFLQMARGWARGTEPPRRFMPYFCKPTPGVGEPVPDRCDRSALVQPIWVEDVARAVAESLDREAPIGEVEPLVGPEALTWPQLLVTIHDATPGAKKKIQPMGVPGVMASHLARLTERVGLSGLLPFGPSEPLMAIEDNTGSPAKARADLGLEPAPLADALA